MNATAVSSIVKITLSLSAICSGSMKRLAKAQQTIMNLSSAEPCRAVPCNAVQYTGAARGRLVSRSETVGRAADQEVN